MADKHTKAGSKPEQTKSITVVWTEDRQAVRDIKAEIWRLVQQAPDLETVHWYTWVDDCFENDEFMFEDWGNLKWRIQVLNMKHEPINRLANMIDSLVPAHVKADDRVITAASPDDKPTKTSQNATGKEAKL